MPALPTHRLDGKTALVTGAGRGLGVGMAHGLAQAGAKVILVSRSRNEIEAVASKIREDGGLAETIILDVLDDNKVQKTFTELTSLDILVNNAGTNVPQPFVEVERSALDKLLQLNVRAAFIVAQAAAQRMLEDNDRRVRGRRDCQYHLPARQGRHERTQRLHDDEACAGRIDQGDGD